MKILNLGEDYATITGGFVKKGAVTEIEDWELPLMKGIGAKVEIVVEEPETTETVKKKKK